MPDPLATPTDLANLLQVDPYTGAELTHVTDLLARASGEIRSAIGQIVTLVEDDTISLPVEELGTELELPELPVVSVSAVAIDDKAVTDYKLIGSKLYRWLGWADRALYWIGQPANVTVTYTHGIATVPEELNTLCCSLAAYAKAQLAATGTLGPMPGVASEAIDDYRRVNTTGDAAIAHVMELPEGTKKRLRAAYGTGAATVSMG